MTTPTILIADDDKDYLIGTTRRLEHAGYTVLQANSGDDAVKLALEREPDLLILDVHMPSGDGFQCIERLDHHPSLSLLPVIYVTGDRAEHTRISAVRHGAMRVLRKPVDQEELLETIELLIGKACSDPDADQRLVA